MLSFGTHKQHGRDSHVRRSLHHNQHHRNHSVSKQSRIHVVRTDLAPTVWFRTHMTLDFAVMVACETRKRHIADLRHLDNPMVERRLVSDGQPACGWNIVPSCKATRSNRASFFISSLVGVSEFRDIVNVKFSSVVFVSMMAC